jgi:hypothetical protein
VYASQRQLFAPGIVLVRFDEIAIELFDEIENSLRVTVIHSARSEVLD